MPYLKYYRRGPTWILCCHLGRRLGLIHLGGPQWWQPIIIFPRTLYRHLRIALKS